MKNYFNAYNNIYNKDYKNIDIIPIITYTNIDINRFTMTLDNKDKCGVYRLINNINGKCYLSSSISLDNKFKVYYSLSSLRKVKGSIIICRALSKYGHSKFSLDILEYCEPSILMEREQYYTDLLKPEYNIKLTKAKP